MQSQNLPTVVQLMIPAEVRPEAIVVQLQVNGDVQVTTTKTNVRSNVQTEVRLTTMFKIYIKKLKHTTKQKKKQNLSYRIVYPGKLLCQLTC